MFFCFIAYEFLFIWYFRYYKGGTHGFLFVSYLAFFILIVILVSFFIYFHYLSSLYDFIDFYWILFIWYFRYYKGGDTWFSICFIFSVFYSHCYTRKFFHLFSLFIVIIRFYWFLLNFIYLIFPILQRSLPCGISHWFTNFSYIFPWNILAGLEIILILVDEDFGTDF